MKPVSDEHPTVVAIPEVVSVAIVAVQPYAVLVAFHVEHVQVTIGVADCAKRHLRHHPLNTLWIESYLEILFP